MSAPDCGPLVESFLDKPPPEPLSQAALEVLSIVAHEQPLTRADISHFRGTDSSGVIDTLLGRGLIADDPRFGGRGRPSFLATTAAFLRLLDLGSLAELPCALRPRTCREPRWPHLTDPLDIAFRAVDRAHFCLDDEGNQLHQTSAPEVIARMLRALNVKTGARVLEIGTGSGFSTALFAELVGTSGVSGKD